MRVRGFGELEAAVMDRMWDHDPYTVTVREIFEEMAQQRQIAYTTVMSTMDNLHTKGWLDRERDGRAYRYWAVMTREEHTARLMREALDGEVARTGAEPFHRTDRTGGVREAAFGTAPRVETRHQCQAPVSLAACLLLYSAAILLGGPPVLRALTRAGRVPGWV